MATGLANTQALSDSRETGERLIRQQLSRAGRYVRWVELGSQAITLIVATLVFFLVAAFIDHWLFSLGTVGRWLFLLALVGGWVWFLATRMLPLLIRAVNPKYAAWAIEEATPSLKNSLLNFLLLKDDRGAVKESVLVALEQRAASDIAQVEIDSTIDRAPLIRVGYVLCGVLAVVALYKIASPKDPFQTAARVVAPWADLARPSRVLIRDVQPGHTSVYLGSMVEITADVQGVRKGDEVRLVYSTADGQVQDRAVPMKAAAGGRTFVATLPASEDGGPAKGNSSGLQQGVQYHIAAGDALSSVYEIRVRMKPTIAVERAELVFPSYTLKASQTQDSGEIKALEGTRVTIHARANQAIKTAFLELDPRPGRAAETIPLTVDGQEASGSFTLQLKPDRVTPWREAYQVRFTNEQGEMSEQPVLHKLEVMPDLPPEVEILAPQQSRVDLPEDSRLTLEARGIDPDFALAELALAGKRGDKEIFKQSLLPPGEPRSQASGKYELVPAQLELKAGDTVKVQAHVADNRRDPLTGQPQPGRAQTSEVTIQIVAARKPNPNEAANNPEPKPNEPNNQGAQANPENKPPMPGANQQQNPEQKPDPKNPNQGQPNQPMPQQPMEGGKGQQGNQNSGQGSSSKNENGAGQSGQSEPNKSQPGQGANNQEGKGQEGEPPPMQGQNPNGSGSGQSGTGQNQTGQGQNASDPSGAGGQQSKQPGGQQNPSGNGRDPGSPDASQQNPNEQGNPAGNPGGQTGNPGGENAQPGANPQSGNNSGGKPEHDGEKFEKLLEELKRQSQEKKNQPGQNQPGQGNNQPGQTAPNDAPSGQTQNQPGGGNQNQPGQNSQPGGKPTPAQPGAGKPQQSQDADGQLLKDIEKMIAEERQKNGQQPMPTQGNETAQNDQGQPVGNQPNGAGQRGNPMQPQPGANQPGAQQQPGAGNQPMADPMSGNEASNQPGTPQNGAGQRPGEPTQSGSPQGSPRTDEGKQPGQSEGEQKKPGAGQTGDPGAGSQSKDPTGSGTGQEANRDQPKDMSADNRGNPNSNEASPPSTSKNQSNSKGGASGDQSGGGKQGAGQPGGKGNDTAGGSSPGDEGSGAAKEQGKGETGSKAGASKPAAGKTGASGKEPGQGSSTRPDQAGKEQGAGGEKSKDPSDPRGNKPTGKQGAGEGSPGGPTGGGQPGDRSDAGITENSADVADEANLDYTRKVTDLVLEHLRNQEHNPDPELAKKMQLTPQELQEFARRWSQLKEEAARDPNKARELDEALRSLGMKLPGNRRRAGAGSSDKVRDLRDSGSRTQAPSKYREQFDQFRKSTGK